MAEDLRYVGNADAQRIDSTDAAEMREWAKRLGASETELKQAIMQVGNSVRALQDHLGVTKRSG